MTEFTLDFSKDCAVSKTNCAGFTGKGKFSYWTCRAGKHTFVMDVQATAPKDIKGKGSNMLGWTFETNFDKKNKKQQCERFRMYVEEG